MQFENSLGRLTAASVHNPRKVIDLQRDGSLDKDDVKGREMKRFKQLLIDVETVIMSAQTYIKIPILYYFVV